MFSDVELSFPVSFCFTVFFVGFQPMEGWSTRSRSVLRCLVLFLNTALLCQGAKACPVLHNKMFTRLSRREPSIRTSSLLHFAMSDFQDFVKSLNHLGHRLAFQTGKCTYASASVLTCGDSNELQHCLLLLPHEM